MIAFLLSNWKWLALVIVIGGLIGALKIESIRLDGARADKMKAESDRDAWKENANKAADTADANAAAFNDLQAAYTKNQAIADATRARNDKLAHDLNSLRKAIHDAPQQDDGPVSNVLRAALDGVRTRQANAPAIH